MILLARADASRLGLCCALLSAPVAALAAAADAPVATHVQASLIARTAVPGETHTLWVGVRMLHATGWHTYWKNPGDAGLPTRIEWQLPEGWSAGDIEWPAPRRIANGGGFASYGYEGELVLPVMVFTPRDWNGRTPVQLSARVSWLACRETCIPESAQLSLELPVSAASTRTALLERFLQRTPEAFNFSAVRAQRHDHRLQLVLEPAREGEFFPDQEQLIEPGDAPVSQRTGQAVMWSAKLGEQGEHYAVGTHISGIWIEKGARPRRVEAALDSP